MKLEQSRRSDQRHNGTMAPGRNADGFFGFSAESSAC